MKANVEKCPCCGAKPEVNWGHTQHDCWAYVTCHNCGLHTRNFHGANDREAASKALEAWNVRKGQMALFALEG